MARQKSEIWIVLLVTGLLVAGTGLGILSWNATPMATAELLLRIQRPAAMSPNEYEDYRNAQRKIMVSDFLLRRAVEDPLIARTEFVARHKDPVAAMSSALTATIVEGEDTTRLTFRCQGREEAETILNEIVDEYLSDVVVVARVQREELLRPVQRTRDKIAARIGVLRLVHEEATAATKRNVTQLTSWRDELTTERSGSSDESRTTELDTIITFADERLSGSDGGSVTLPEWITELNAAIEVREQRLAELTADLAEWTAHTLPKIEVIQYATIIDATP